MLSRSENEKVPNAIKAFLSNEQNTDDEATETVVQNSTNDEKEKQNQDKEETPAQAGAMIATIGFYEQFISPLLPQACRFVPKCVPNMASNPIKSLD
jgi:tRNA A37 threonylcarbamoyladenosine dehydratase